MKIILVIFLSILAGSGFQGTTSSKDYNTIDLKTKYSGWQGVCSDGKTVYITSDRDKNFELSNTISVYGMDGSFKKVKTDAYTKKDQKGRFMSFGDCFVTGDSLYAAVYNFNSGPPEDERISRMVKYKLPSLKQEKVFELGKGTAESIALYKDSFWVVYHDKNRINQYDSEFNLIKSYSLSAPFGDEGGYQGIFFDGDNLYGNLHGSNEYGQSYAQGLDHYQFDGRNFKYVERIKPPTYGAGQGVDKVGDVILWNDRPGNKIIITIGLNYDAK